MYKYKYFLIFLGAIAVLLLWCLFPIAFDNNDDQAMYMISAGMISGIPSPNIILSNIANGKILNHLFAFSMSVNWYSLYLETILLLCFLTISWIFIKKKNNTIFTITFIVMTLFLGFFSLAVVKLQFTTVALFCAATALLLLQSEIKFLPKLCGIVFFLTAAIFIRKEAGYIFLLFSLAVFITNLQLRIPLRSILSAILVAVLVLIAAHCINNHNDIYSKQQTYNNIKALDIIAATPIKTDADILQQYNFTSEDIVLMQSWFAADEAYLSGNKIKELAEALKSNRDNWAVLAELYKFVADERYLLFIYAVTVFMVILFARSSYITVLLNLTAFLGLLLYLAFTYRIPHRITFPILSYLVLINLFFVVESKEKTSLKMMSFSFLLLISCYKFYCTAALIQIHKNYFSEFAASKQEINAHPENLFITIDGFPTQYMNAWHKPSDGFPASNLILTGWYACSPDYQVMLKKHNLKNLTSDLRNKKNILFLTDSETFQDAYVQVMKNRYHLDCHFETQHKGFKQLRPKRLVFDN